jgi:hypothetical protein
MNTHRAGLISIFLIAVAGQAALPGKAPATQSACTSKGCIAIGAR